MLPTKGNKKFLEMAKSMARWYGSVPTKVSVQFVHCLVAALNTIIVVAQKRPGTFVKEI